MKNAGGIARILLSAACAGALLVLAYPRFNLFWTAWFAPALLFYALRGGSKLKRFAAGWVFGLVFLGGLLFWINSVRYPAPIGYAVGIPLFAAMFGVYGIIAGAALDRREPFFAFLMPPALWTALEYLWSLGPLAFPWWAVGYSQSVNLPVAQAASWGSVFAVSFIVMLANTALFAAASGLRKRQAGVVAVAAFTAAVVISGIVMLASGGDAGKRVSLAIIQGGFTQSEKEDPQTFVKMYQKHLEMSREAARRHAPDMIVWSETLADRSWIAGDSTLPWMMLQLAEMETALVTGVYDYRDGKDYNTVLAISPEKGVLGEYDKMHLVPFGEYVPLRRQLSASPALKKWIDEAIYKIDTQPGRKLRVIPTEWGGLSVVVCFESILPGISRRMTNEGAGLLMVLTNDAWFGRSSAASQHAAMAVFRAIENRRFMVQGAASGVSLIVDPWGRKIAESKVMSREILHGDVAFREGRSVYGAAGDVFSWLCLAAAAGGAAVMLSQRPKKKPAKRSRKAAKTAVEKTKSEPHGNEAAKKPAPPKPAARKEQQPKKEKSRQALPSIEQSKPAKPKKKKKKK